MNLNSELRQDIDSRTSADQVCSSFVADQNLPKNLSVYLMQQMEKRCAWIRERDGYYMFDHVNRFDVNLYDFDNNGWLDYLIIWGNSPKSAYDYALYLFNENRFIEIDLEQNEAIFFNTKEAKFFFLRYGGHCNKMAHETCVYEASLSDIANKNKFLLSEQNMSEKLIKSDDLELIPFYAINFF